MDIYDYAMKFEVDGEKYYRDIAQQVQDPGLKTILSMLADAEVLHYNIFKAMKNQEPIKMQDTNILNDVKNVFIRMRENKENIAVDSTELDLYKKAQEIEKMTEDFYTEKSKEVQTPGQKEIFLKVAEEERRHYFILQNIIDFVGRPYNWLENAEWYHLEQY